MIYNCNSEIRGRFVTAPLVCILSLLEEYLMSNDKAQSSNEIQSPKCPNDWIITNYQITITK